MKSNIRFTISMLATTKPQREFVTKSTLTSIDEPILLSIEGKIGSKDLAKALNLVVKYQIELLEKWREIHE